MPAGSIPSIGRRTAAVLVGGVVAVILSGACSSDAGTDTTAGGGGSTSTTARATGSSSAPTSRPSSTSTGAPGTGDTSTTATAGAPSTDVDPPASAEAELRGDGLGVAAFGDAEGATLASLTATFGPWTQDEGWRSGDENILGVENRMVAWGGLWVSFTKGDVGPVFSSWRYTAEHADVPGPTPDLTGPDGLRLGAMASGIEGLADAEPVSGEGAVGYRLLTEDGPVNLWFDPPATSSGIDPASTLVILDAGEMGSPGQA